MAVALGVLDGAIIVVTLIISFAIGVYYAYQARNSTSLEEYFVGNRKIPVFVAACSLIASTVPGSSMVSVPSDAYFRGPGRWFGTFIANIVESIVLPLFIVPVYRRLELINVYDYLALRFDKKVKYFAVIAQVIYTIFITAIGIYAPSLAISTIADIDINLLIALSGGICVIYTAIGGTKAVVWNDTFQILVMVVGMVVFFIVSLPLVGGFGNVLEVGENGGRSLRIDTTFDLKLPYTLYALVIGFIPNALTRSAVGQISTQRYAMAKDLRGARIISIAGQLLAACFFISFQLISIVMYTYYERCDPFTNGEIDKRDQVFPLFISEIFADYPGLLGLMIAAVICSSLSTVSSAINSLTVLTHAELGKLFLRSPSPKQVITFTKIITFAIGCLIMGIAFFTRFIEGILDAILTWAGIIIGPILAVFILGMVSRRVNSTGALVGLICSSLIGVWLRIGNTYYPRARSTQLPLSVEGCEVTMGNITEAPINQSEPEDIPPSIYQLSSLYYSALAFVVVWTVASVVSLWTGPTDPGQLNEDLFIRCPKMRPKQRATQESTKELDYFEHATGNALDMEQAVHEA